ncbi:hypothetical protein [Salipiger mucosus]|uniref:hypothetical protein n=1 Tax=Salipiger mucosus TaxID=263378 RepID=UPI0012EC7058|nr:hypothetical protein [Salipiger mucosus]
MKEFLIDTLAGRPELAWKDGEATFRVLPQEERDSGAIILKEGESFIKLPDGRIEDVNLLYPCEDRQTLLDDLLDVAPDFLQKKHYCRSFNLMPGSLIFKVPNTLPAGDYAFYAMVMAYAMVDGPPFICRVPADLHGSMRVEPFVDPIEVIDAMLSLTIMRVLEDDLSDDELNEQLFWYANI